MSIMRVTKLISRKSSTMARRPPTFAYTYDADGNRISETGRIGTDKVNKTYEYFVENRLAAVRDGRNCSLAAAYDGDGNRVFLLNYNLHTDDDWKRVLRQRQREQQGQLRQWK